MFSGFQHYLSYGSTDQQTVRELSQDFDGLLVPGTVAAFQADGTKGFVLTLSARSADPYVIDPRFPLFQNQLTSPKKSHNMLAELLGVPSLVNVLRAPRPSDFDDRVIETVADRWIQFNSQFDDVQSKTFDKYAARLNEEILPGNRQQPQFILPPYLMPHSSEDGWADVSARIWRKSLVLSEEQGTPVDLRRVIAATSPELWGDLVVDCPEGELLGWVSKLDEFDLASESRLLRYAQEIQRAREAGKSLFALYGGFFSVLLGRYGLSGSSHGIGFGEHRDWIELPNSGAPPARYYVSRLHRYVGVDVAASLWRHDPDLVACDCQECGGLPPEALEYHALMKHSVIARSREIREWLTLPTDEVVARLDRDLAAFESAVSNLDEPVRLVRRAEDVYSHLPMWSRIMTAAG